MIKKKRKIKVPTAEFGLLNTNLLIGGLATLGTQAIEASTNSKHETSGLSALSAVTSGLGMMGTGAGLGALFGGPLGAGLGAAAGVITGVLSSGLTGGRNAEMTSFTDYDEGELAGFLRPGRRRRLKELRDHYQQLVYGNRAAVSGTEYLRNRYDELNGLMDGNTFANGGTTASLAYVDDGELISTPDGLISKVPELGRPTDSNLVSLPEGSKILSDSLKVPGTNKTFALVGEEMMATKKSKFNDTYALNAAKLNEMNNKSIHDLLFEILEAVKSKKGIKRKYKNAVVAADNGDEVPEYLRRPDDPPIDYSVSWGVGNTIVPMTPIPQGEGVKPIILQPAKPIGRISPQVNQWAYGDNFKYLVDGKYDLNYLNFINNALTLDMIDRAIKEQPLTFSRFRSSNPNYRPLLEDVRKWATDYKPSDFHRFAEYIYDNRNRLSNTPNKEFKLTPKDWVNDSPAMRQLAIEDLNDSLSNTELPVVKEEPEIDNNRISIDWLGPISGLAGLSPIISNLLERPEYESPVYNPYTREVLRTMHRRRYNINPAIRDIERNRAITNYDAGLMNTNTGADLAFRLLNASNTNRAIADLRSQESNINNAYLGEYSQMAANLGEQWAAESRRVDQNNMANRAQARNIRRAGLSGLSQWALNRELMNNQRNRDNMMMALYEPFLQSGFTTQDLANFRNWLRRTNG